MGKLLEDGNAVRDHNVHNVYRVLLEGKVKCRLNGLEPSSFSEGRWCCGSCVCQRILFVLVFWESGST